MSLNYPKLLNNKNIWKNRIGKCDYDNQQHKDYARWMEGVDEIRVALRSLKWNLWSPDCHCGCIWSKEVIKVKWDHMDGALFQLTFLLAETPESSLSLHSTWGHRKKVYICKVGRQPSPGLESTGTLILCLAAGRWSLGPRKGPYWQECLCFPGGQSNDVIYDRGFEPCCTFDLWRN